MGAVEAADAEVHDAGDDGAAVVGRTATRWRAQRGWRSAAQSVIDTCASSLFPLPSTRLPHLSIAPLNHVGRSRRAIDPRRITRPTDEELDGEARRTDRLDVVLDRRRDRRVAPATTTTSVGGVVRATKRSAPRWTRRRPQVPAAMRWSRRSAAGIVDSSQVGVVRPARALRDLAPVAQGAVEQRAEVRRPAVLVVHPWTGPQRRPVTHVLTVQAVETGHPVTDLVGDEADDVAGDHRRTQPLAARWARSSRSTVGFDPSSVRKWPPPGISTKR